MSDMRSVLVIGSTGTGKSSIGNEALRLDPARDSREEVVQEKGWCTSPDPRSCSDRVLTKGPRAVQYDTDNGVRGYQMTWTDTPGVPDTEGRGTVFLDKIVEEMRRFPPHVIVYAVNANGRFNNETELSLLALRECLNNMLSDIRLVVFVNKLPTDFSCRGREGTPDAIRKEIADKWYKMVVGKLLPEGGDTVPLVMNQDQSFDGVATLLRLIHDAPDTPMDVREFRTWSEVVKNYEDLLSGAKSADDVVAEKIRNLGAEITEASGNLQWHENRIRDLTTAIACTAWIPFAGPVSAGGMAIAIADSRGKVGKLNWFLGAKQREVDEAKRNKQECLEKEVRRCEKLRNEIRDLEAEVNRSMGN